jgi:hypothetical protein
MSNETKDILPPNVAENLAYWDQKISETEQFLKQNPDPRLASGTRDLLTEYKAKREKVLYEFEHPAPAPPPPPTPELIKRISDEVQALLPEIVARVIVGLAGKK